MALQADTTLNGSEEIKKRKKKRGGGRGASGFDQQKKKKDKGRRLGERVPYFFPLLFFFLNS